ncbi:MAG: hypothetical protein ACE5EV_01400 [Gaiellales bacterium]
MSAIERLSARDGRPLALVVRGDFDDFASHPPTFETEEERAWLAEHYRVASPDLERETKAHVTDDALPLQVTILNRPSGASVNPHWHVNEGQAASATRHQVMICLSGSARIGVFERQGPHAGDVVLRPGDLVLLAEGHSVETLEDQTRLIEIKQGPMPADPFADNVPIAHAEETS